MKLYFAWSILLCVTCSIDLLQVLFSADLKKFQSLKEKGSSQKKPVSIIVQLVLLMAIHMYCVINIYISSMLQASKKKVDLKKCQSLKEKGSSQKQPVSNYNGSIGFSYGYPYVLCHNIDILFLLQASKRKVQEKKVNLKKKKT